MSNETKNGNIKPIFTRLTPEAIELFHAKPALTINTNEKARMPAAQQTQPVRDGSKMFRRLPS